jgi:hypothetical protein
MALLPLNRADFRGGRKPVLRDVCSTEQNERLKVPLMRQADLCYALP